MNDEYLNTKQRVRDFLTIHNQPFIENFTTREGLYFEFKNKNRLIMICTEWEHDQIVEFFNAISLYWSRHFDTRFSINVVTKHSELDARVKRFAAMYNTKLWFMPEENAATLF